MKKRLLFGAIAWIMAVVADSSASIAAPDIIFFLADDLGSTFIGPESRSVSVATPNIDALGREGIVFTSAYATPVCVQARTLLMAGKWNQRNSVGAVISNGPQPPASMITIAERLQARGYATSLVGKWHLGFTSGKHPNDQGFDQFYGFQGTTPNYVGDDPKAPLFRNRTRISNTGNVTDTLGSEAVRQLNAPRSKPLFLYVGWTAPHDPLQDTLANVLAKMDQNIGRVVAAAKPDTLFVFAGDNGRASGSNKPFKGGKYDIWEGGVRVPFAMKWKGQIAAGQRIATPVSLVDFAATAIAASGATLIDTDGLNLLKPVPADRPVFFQAYGGQGEAVRQGKWKLYLGYGGVATQLYDVTTDKGETKNVAAGNGATVSELSALISHFKAALDD
jgi:arylsulfatase A-like enzyme